MLNVWRSQKMPVPEPVPQLGTVTEPETVPEPEPATVALRRAIVYNICIQLFF